MKFHGVVFGIFLSVLGSGCFRSNDAPETKEPVDAAITAEQPAQNNPVNPPNPDNPSDGTDNSAADRGSDRDNKGGGRDGKSNQPVQPDEPSAVTGGDQGQPEEPQGEEGGFGTAAPPDAAADAVAESNFEEEWMIIHL